MEKNIISAAETAAFCSQLGLILKSGISALEGLSLLHEDADGAEKALLDAILEDFSLSSDLALALDNRNCFPDYMIRMVHLGETTGTLDHVLETLALHYDREDSITRSIKNSITYPFVMATMIVVVIIVLLVKVMPIFQQVFIQLGTEMTGMSGLLYRLGTLLSANASLLLGLLVLLLLLLLWGLSSPRGRAAFLSLSRRLPVTRRIHEKTALFRFAGGMGLALSAGLDPERSLELAASTNEDPLLQKKLEACQGDVAQGMDLSEAFHNAGVFDGVNARLVLIGQRTGTMEDVMNQISQRTREDIEAGISDLLSVIEPAMVVILSVIVGVILLSVMLPLMGIMSSL